MSRVINLRLCRNRRQRIYDNAFDGKRNRIVDESRKNVCGFHPRKQCHRVYGKALGCLLRSLKAKRVAKKIPAVYDEKKLAKRTKKYTKIIKKLKRIQSHIFQKNNYVQDCESRIASF